MPSDSGTIVSKVPPSLKLRRTGAHVLNNAWVGFLNDFLELSSYPILEDKGKVSALEAKLKAEAEFEVFREQQDKEFISDFDREVKRLEGKPSPGID